MIFLFSSEDITKPLCIPILSYVYFEIHAKIWKTNVSIVFAYPLDNYAISVVHIKMKINDKTSFKDEMNINRQIDNNNLINTMATCNYK